MAVAAELILVFGEWPQIEGWRAKGRLTRRRQTQALGLVAATEA